MTVLLAMKINLRRTLLLLACIVSLAVASARSAEIVANSDNKETIDEELLKLVLTGKEKFWDSGSEVVIAILKSNSEVDDTVAQYSGMTKNKFRNHWQRIVFSGRGKMPKMFSNVEDLIKFVQANKGAIGILSENTNTQDLRKIKLSILMMSSGKSLRLIASNF